MISLAIKEKDNFEEVEVKVSRAKLDANGCKVTEKATSKNGKEFYKVVKEEVTEKAKKDMPSRLAARRKMIANPNKVKDENGNNATNYTLRYRRLSDSQLSVTLDPDTYVYDGNEKRPAVTVSYEGQTLAEGVATHSRMPITKMQERQV